VLANQALYLMSHISSPFLLWLFWRWGALMNYLPELALNHDPPISASQVARIRDLRNWSLAKWTYEK
jgi:hypothetical protein